MTIDRPKDIHCSFSSVNRFTHLQMSRPLHRRPLPGNWFLSVSPHLLSASKWRC